MSLVWVLQELPIELRHVRHAIVQQLPQMLGLALGIGGLSLGLAHTHIF